MKKSPILVLLSFALQFIGLRAFAQELHPGQNVNIHFNHFDEISGIYAQGTVVKIGHKNCLVAVATIVDPATDSVDSSQKFAVGEKATIACALLTSIQD